MQEGRSAIDDALLRLWAASRNRLLGEGLTPAELSSLVVVETCARREEQDEEAHISDVAEFADIAPAAASRLVDSAEEAGLVFRQPSRVAGWTSVLILTWAGLTLRQRAAATRTHWLADEFESWSRCDVDELGRLLQRLADQVNPEPHVVVRQPSAESRSTS